MGIISTTIGSTTISSTQVTTSDLQESQGSAASSTQGGDMLPETTQKMLQGITTLMETMFNMIGNEIVLLNRRMTDLEASTQEIGARIERLEDQTKLLQTSDKERKFARIWFFKTGCKYEGQFNEVGQPHGLGTAKLKGNLYTGMFHQGLRHGFGKVVYSDGDEYEGEFQNDLENGSGKYLDKNGNEYEGEMQNGRRHGRGILKSINGDVYEGEFVDGLMHGQGKITHADGDIYEGGFLKGNKHGFGKGRKNYKRGLYEGEFQNGYPYGQGKMTIQSKDSILHGNIYVSQFNGENQKGFCICTYKNGDVYIGEMNDYKRNGQGTMTYVNGDVLEGIFFDDYVQNGATMRCKNGNVYTGKFNGNVFFEGEGTLKYPNGDTYIGKIKNFCRYEDSVRIDNVIPHGEGVLIKPCGFQYHQTWKDGKLLKNNMI